jgi:hypothetical protein
VLTGSVLVEFNGIASIYLGCSDTTGPDGIPCVTPSSANEIDVQSFDGASVTLYGIAIDKGAIANTIMGNSSVGDTIDDMYDGNAIGKNTWLGNTFGTSNVSFIH